MFSTLTAVRLGHVFEGQMVNLRIDNIKLRQRAVRMVASIAGLTEVDAARFIDEAGGSVKAALLLASGAGDKASAEALLAGNNDNVRLALEALRRK
jgi:N-acetylmuramic acid 6-phosphate etherase